MSNKHFYILIKPINLPISFDLSKHTGVKSSSRQHLIAGNPQAPAPITAIRFACLKKINKYSFTHLPLSAMIHFKIRVSLMEQELPTLREHMSSTPVFSGVRITRSLVLGVVFCISLLVLLSFFILAIVLSILMLVSSHSSIYKVNRQ